MSRELEEERECAREMSGGRALSTEETASTEAVRRSSGEPAWLRQRE